MPVLPGAETRQTQPIRVAPVLPGAGSNVYDEAQGLWALPAPTGEVVSATAEETFVRNPVPSLSREFGRIETERGVAAERRDRLSPLNYSTELPEDEVRLYPEEANRKYGVDFYGKNVLSWDGPVTESTAKELHDLKVAELRRETILSRSEGGGLQGLARFGTGLAVSAIDPLNIASAFVPVFGEARYLQLLAGASGAFGRAGIRAGVGALEGAAGAALVEPIVYGVAQSEQADYGLTDSFLNIVFGGVLGGGLHVGFGALGDRIGTSSYAREIERLQAERPFGPVEFEPEISRETVSSRAVDDINDLSPEVRDDLLRASVAELVQNGEIRATGALAEGLSIGEPLRGEPGWRFTEEDVAALRVEQPELVARSDEAMARLAEVEARAGELRQRLESQTEADAVAVLDEASGERIRAIDEELAGTVPARRRTQLQRERDAIIETLGRENVSRAAKDISIGPSRRARDAERSVATARKEARRANRELQAALGGRDGASVVQSATEALKPEPVTQAPDVPQTSVAEAAAELRDIEVRLAAMDAISPLSPEARLALDEADVLIERSNNEAEALEIALACATRN